MSAQVIRLADRRPTRGYISLDTLILILGTCRAYHLTDEQCADVLIDLERKGFYT